MRGNQLHLPCQARAVALRISWRHLALPAQQSRQESRRPCLRLSLGSPRLIGQLASSLAASLAHPSRRPCLSLRSSCAGDKVEGKAKEGLGSLTGDQSKKNEGQAQNAAGKATNGVLCCCQSCALQAWLLLRVYGLLCWSDTSFVQLSTTTW